MKAYLSGPMTGLPHLNFPAFIDATQRLRALGRDIVSPVEINPDPEAKWVDCMRRDIKALCDCDEIILLPGWTKSRGAVLEHAVAVSLNLKVTSLHEVLPE